MSTQDNTEHFIVETHGLHKSYGEFSALRDMDLRVCAGEIFAFLGPNGAGKTTTIRMLMGILQPTSGAAFIDGLDCFAARVAVKRRVGYLPDDPVFYNYLRGSEIIQFVGEMHGLKRTEIVARANPLVVRLGLSGDLEEYAVNFSRGMKKKLGLVCALLHAPKLLILDEPSNGLDPYATRVLQELIREKAAEGMSIFFSTHLLEQAEKLCTRVGILFQGKLVADGPLEYLRRNRGGSLEEVFFAVTQPDREHPGWEG